MTRGRKLLIGLVVLAVIATATIAELLRSERGTPVRVETIGEREIVATITATGHVRARRQVNISSDVMGRVVELNVAEGQEVEQDELLLVIDPRQVEAAVARARASLAQTEAQVAQQRANLLQAERELTRLRELRTGGVVTEQELESAETRVEVQQAMLSSSLHGVEQARAALEEAEEQRSRTTIRAPIAGRVIRLNIEEGETAVVGTMNNAGSLLLTIGDLSAIEAVMVVDETDVPMISMGDSAVVELDAFPGQTFAARVSSIGNSSTQSAGTQQGSVTYEVILSLLERPENLRPDLSATADIIVERREQAIGAPIISVTLEPEAESGSGGAIGVPEAEASPATRAREEPAQGVFLVRDGRAVWTPVTLGVTGQEYFEVVEGLQVGDVVVSGPFQTIQQLRDGTPVQVTGESNGAP